MRARQALTRLEARVQKVDAQVQKNRQIVQELLVEHLKDLARLFGLSLRNGQLARVVRGFFDELARFGARCVVVEELWQGAYRKTSQPDISFGCSEAHGTLQSA